MMDEKDNLDLKKRYLIWLYKETREALDRVDRKFTQLDIDKFILEELQSAPGAEKKFLDELISYTNNKEEDCRKLKSGDAYLNASTGFFSLKLKAIEKAL